MTALGLQWVTWRIVKLIPGQKPLPRCIAIKSRFYCFATCSLIYACKIFQLKNSRLALLAPETKTRSFISKSKIANSARMSPTMTSELLPSSSQESRVVCDPQSQDSLCVSNDLRARRIINSLSEFTNPSQSRINKSSGTDDAQQ